MKRAPTLREFKLILQGFSDTDKIGHLFLVNIEFDKKTQLKNKYFLNEIYPPIFEKEEYLNKFPKLDLQDEYFDAKKKFIRNSGKKSILTQSF